MKQPSESELTGLLLVYPNCLVHMMEGRASILHSVLQELQQTNPSDSRHDNIRVVLSMEDVPARTCTSWFAAHIPSTSGIEAAEPPTKAQAIKLSADLVSCLRKIGSHLSTLSEADCHRQLQSLATYHEDLPLPENVLSLVPAEDCPTLRDYLDLYTGAPSVVLDDQIVWPVPRGIKF
eukprot:jgi/Chrzof1/12230/Cz06g26110.t1